MPDERLMVNYLSGNADADVKIQVESWISEHPDNEKSFILFEKIYQNQKIQQRILTRDANAAFKSVMQRSKMKSRRVFLQRVSVAASILVLLSSLGLYFFGKEKLPESAVVVVTAPANAQTKVYLPDGTEVFLNRGSNITYPAVFSEKQRDVVLNGEAFFNVAHNPEKPFVLSNKSEQYKIKVLGTAFNVQAHERGEVIQTTLVSGSIELCIAALGSKNILTPSQRATYTIGAQQLQIADVDTDRDLDWIYNRLVFRNTPMPVVLDRLAAFYNVRFDVQSKKVETYTFTGTFEDKSLYQVLDYIKIASKLNYKILHADADRKVTTVQLFN